ncbi:MAG TPA: MarR family transcriptional regulator [Alphaproteobacteria bacterium]|nr:MarR family transcriptional regulator [Alphaproteobacteria bacterium]
MAADGPSLDLEKQLCFALYSASRAMTTAYRPILKSLGITYPQYLVFLLLWERDKLSPTEIGERLLLDSGTLSPMIKRMEKAGLVSRVRDIEDERSVRIVLTKKGRALRAQAVSVPDAIACKVNISIEQADRLRREINKVTRALQSSNEGVGGKQAKSDVTA